MKAGIQYSQWEKLQNLYKGNKQMKILDKTFIDIFNQDNKVMNESKTLLLYIKSDLQIEEILFHILINDTNKKNNGDRGEDGVRTKIINIIKEKIKNHAEESIKAKYVLTPGQNRWFVANGSLCANTALYGAIIKKLAENVPFEELSWFESALFPKFT